MSEKAESGTVLAVCVSREKGTQKQNVGSAHFIDNSANVILYRESPGGVSCAEKDEKKESQLVRKTCFSDANMGL